MTWLAVPVPSTIVTLLAVMVFLATTDVRPARAQTTEPASAQAGSADIPAERGLPSLGTDVSSTELVGYPDHGLLTAGRPTAPDVPLGSDVVAPGMPPPGALYRTLEASFIGLQALDTASTLLAVRRGLVEANPIMRALTDRPAAFVAVKATTTVGIALLGRRLVRSHRVSGLILMAAMDSAYSIIVANNFALVTSHRPR